MEVSILAPLLFLIYVNHLYKCSKKLDIRMFADDTACFLEDNNLTFLFNVLKSELNKVDQWLRANKLSINVSKTKYIIFHSKRKRIDSNINLSFDNTTIERVSTIKHLEIHLQEILH